MPIEINCNCDECSKNLDGENAICEDCIEKKEKDSYEEGKKEGFDDGYAEAEADFNI